MLLERERGADHKKRFWPGKPFKRNAKRLADDAARAIGPDEPSAAVSTCWIGSRHSVLTMIVATIISRWVIVGSMRGFYRKRIDRSNRVAGDESASPRNELQAMSVKVFVPGGRQASTPATRRGTQLDAITLINHSNPLAHPPQPSRMDDRF